MLHEDKRKVRLYVHVSHFFALILKFGPLRKFGEPLVYMIL
jgi:hypothetical protein